MAWRVARGVVHGVVHGVGRGGGVVHGVRAVRAGADEMCVARRLVGWLEALEGHRADLRRAGQRETHHREQRSHGLLRVDLGIAASQLVAAKALDVLAADKREALERMVRQPGAEQHLPEHLRAPACTLYAHGGHGMCMVCMVCAWCVHGKRTARGCMVRAQHVLGMCGPRRWWRACRR